MPPTRTAPAVTSMSRGTRPSSVVLPEPVDPTTAVVVPGRTSKVMSDNTFSSAPGYRNCAASNSTEAGSPVKPAGVLDGTTDVSVSRTSQMRSAHTAARGAIIARNDAIITDIMICMT